MTPTPLVSTTSAYPQVGGVAASRTANVAPVLSGGFGGEKAPLPGLEDWRVRNTRTASGLTLPVTVRAIEW